jgi:hypothetical protein
VLKAIVTQLLLHYTRILEVLKRSGPEGQELARGAVSVQVSRIGVAHT